MFAIAIVVATEIYFVVMFRELYWPNLIVLLRTAITTDQFLFADCYFTTNCVCIHVIYCCLGCVEDYQGQEEKVIIIISTVCSDEYWLPYDELHKAWISI